MHESSSSSASSPELELDMVSVVVDSKHSSRCMVKPHCGFDLHFPTE